MEKEIYPKITDLELDDILELISLSKQYGFRNSKEVHIKCNRAEEFNQFYVYFVKNFSSRIQDKILYDVNLRYRLVICVSKKKPDTVFVYVVLKHSRYFTKTTGKISLLLQENNILNFRKILDTYVSDMLKVIEKEYMSESVLY